MTGREPDPDAAALAAYLDAARPDGERQAAFAEIVDRHAHRLHAVCLRVLGAHADAEEAVQETFVRLARSGDAFRGEAALSTWLHRVARNVCTDRVRHDARRPQTPVADIGEVASMASDEATDQAQARLAAGEVGRALLGLDAPSRLLLLLVAVDGLSYAEAAEAADLPIGTVKSRVSRARLRLGELLAGDAEVADGAAAPDGQAPGDARGPADARAPPGARRSGPGAQPDAPG